MASLDNTIKTTALKKPLLVIKKESIFKPSYPIFLKTSLKRPITTSRFATPVDTSAKKTCVTVLDAVQANEQTLIPITSALATPVDTSSKKIGLTVSEAAQSNEQRPTIYKTVAEDVLTPTTSNVGWPLSTDNMTMTKNIVPDDHKDNVPYRVDINCKPSRRCEKHDPLPEYWAEGLPNVGFTFKSGEEFQEYAAKNASKWYFYYTRYDSQNMKSSPNYKPNKSSYMLFGCRFNKKHYKSKSKGIRKRSSILSVSCPAGITLKCEIGKDIYKVQNVCHHHSHELSARIFSQISHGYRLPQEVKDEIRDLALFNVEPTIARRYIESKLPGIDLKNTVYNTFVKVKKEYTKDSMGPERVKEMLAKIKYIKANFTIAGPLEPEDDSSSKAAKKPKKDTKNDFKPKQNKNLSDQISVEDFEFENSSFDTETELWEGTEMDDAENSDVNDDLLQEYQEDPIETSEESVITTTRTYNRALIFEHESLHKTEHSITPIKDYTIGGITIQTAKTVDNSGVATVVLLGVKSEQDFKEYEVINELTKLNSSITQEQESHDDQKVFEDIKAVSTVTKSLPSLFDQHRTEMRCQKRHHNLPEHVAEGLIKTGDTFASIEAFARYAAEHALKWFFYYQIHDSRNVKTSNRYNSNRKTWYNFSCRFDKGRYKSQSTGARKVKQKTIQCPATVSMLCEPGEAEFKVTYACHHHSHELTAEIFSREAHGHRLSSELKDEIRELVWFKLDTRLIRQYLLEKTGFDLKRTIINLLSKMRKDRIKLILTPEREKEIFNKIEEIKQKYSIPKRTPARNKNKLQQEESYWESDDEEGNGSRVEARLNNILYDQALIQSVKELQETTGCEIQIEGGMLGFEGVSHVQGLAEDTENSEYDDNHNDNQIEVDQEQYIMDENIDYVTQTVDNTTMSRDNSQLSTENLVYLHQIEFINGESVCEVEINSTADQDIKNDVYQTLLTDTTDVTNNYGRENTAPGDNNVSYKEEFSGEDKNVQSAENINHSKENIEHVVPNDNHEKNIIYEEVNIALCEESINNTEDITEEENEREYSNDEEDYVERYRENTYIGRNVGVQVDLEIIELEREFENIKELELAMLKTLYSSEQSHHKTISVSTRGRPKGVIEEGIINRYNIEFYINVGGVIPCLENIALNMNLSVLDLLKKLYQGEAVFKMSIGRSGKQDRKTIQLKYLPLTIAFPFERFKCLNVLQEYKTVCSKYTDMAIKLENTVESISTDLNATNERLEMVVSENTELLKVKECYDSIVESHAMNEELLKQSQLDLAEARAENQVLLQKVNNLEALQLVSRLKDAEILKQLLKPRVDCKNSNPSKRDTIQQQGTPMARNLLEPRFECQNNLAIENTIVTDKLRMLEEKSLTNIKIIEKMKRLEEAVKVSDADIERYKEKIKKLEGSYETDTQSLLAKIKALEEELSSLKAEFDNNNQSEKTIQSVMNDPETECKKLHTQINDQGKLKSSEKKKFIEEIKRLYAMITSLNKQLREEKQKKVEVLINYSNT